MTYLIGALAAPLVGPVIYRVVHERSGAFRIVDRFVYFAVPLLVAWQVIPHAVADRTIAPIAAMLVGLAIPLGLERASRFMAEHADDLAIVVGLTGLALHAALEGAAFGLGTTEVAPTFAAAVILHRIPLGLVIWWLIRPRHGVALAAAGVGLIVVATASGAAMAGAASATIHGPGAELYQALVLGSLVHVVFHQGMHDHAHHDHDHEPDDADGRPG